MEEELLTALEGRWNNISVAIGKLQKENAKLRETVSERDQEIAMFVEESTLDKNRLQAAGQEKDKIQSRIARLLKRFEEVEI